MKKRLLSLFILGISFLIPKSVFAVSVSTSCSSQNSVTLGNTVSVTVRGNASDSVMWDLVPNFKDQYLSDLRVREAMSSLLKRNKYNKNVEELECLFFEMTRIYYILVRLL